MPSLITAKDPFFLFKSMLSHAPQLSFFLHDYPLHLFMPRDLPRGHDGVPYGARVSAVIPTCKPPNELLILVEGLCADSLVDQVVVVDDATPWGWENIFHQIKKIEKLRRKGSEKLTLIRLSQNQHRAGAVNEGLKAVSLPPSELHDILVLDDDVTLASGALSALIRQLHADPALGAVCTQARVVNRRQNLLTRLQGLEYLGFNIARVADRGFLQGPLIMHGLASLIRSTVLMKECQGYDKTQLLEDYDLTVRIKSRGYHVVLAEEAVAATVVPSAWGQFWRQRVRWQFGGLSVVTRHRRILSAVFPDMFAHALTLTLLLSILSSFIWHEVGNGESSLITVMRAVSIAMSMVFYVVQLVFMVFMDRGKDWKDVALRALIIPEFFYSFLLSLVLFGSYFFYGYTQIRDVLLRVIGLSSFQKWCMVTDRLFARAGYTTTWGTK